jgi:hypothetical protein
MSWIKLEDGSFAEEANPDPRQVVDADGIQHLLQEKRQEVTMYENELAHITLRKETIEAEIAEIQALIEE